MQKKIPKILIFALIVSVTMIGTGFAFADSTPSANDQQVVIAGLNGGAALKEGGIGALSGVILSIFTVLNKNQNGTGNPDKIDPKKTGLNLIIGAAVGVGLSVIGIDPTNGSVQTAFSLIIPVMVNYAALHWTNLLLRPMFGNWASGKKATDQTPKPSET